MSNIHFKQSPFLEISTIKNDIRKKTRKDGSIILKSNVKLKPHPNRITDRLVHWANKTPDKIFIGQRDKNGAWQTLTYAETLRQVKSIAQYLLQSNVSIERPIAILSENSIEHGLLALAAMHIGVPYSPLATAYSLRSTDYAKLRHTINLLTPGLIFVQDINSYAKALTAIADNVEIAYVVGDNQPPAISNQQTTSFDDILKTEPTSEVDAAFEKITPETVAKILFTSGSTGLPKGVMNTHGNITTNWQQITQTFPIFAEDFTIIDWLPWNHTFGGNHNFGLTVYNGGSMYIDNGNPTPNGIIKTIENLHDIAPTVYFNVPKGFEELIPYLKNNTDLREKFFSKLKMFFYAGAGMPQHVWDDLEKLSYETIGKRLMIGSGLGCTESSPSAMFNTHFDSFAGLVGTPVPGLELKLVPNEGKLEVRFRGKNIMPGYWRQHEVTQKSFDDEGFYKTGDALKFHDEDNPNAGMIFNGRIAEDFKLDTGTWVNVGVLKAKLIAACNGLIQDAAITGHDRAFVGAIVFPDINFCKKLSGLPATATLSDIIEHPKVVDALDNALKELAKTSTGSASFVKKAIFAPFTLSIDAGEITDKGSINQRTILGNHQEVVEAIYK